MKPFNLLEALRGKPVELRNGEVYTIEEYVVGDAYPLKGTQYKLSWTTEGYAWGFDSPSPNDIVGMYEEKPPVFMYWGYINIKYNYIAKDKDGTWYAYTERPSTTTGSDWHIHFGDLQSIGDLLNPQMFPDCNWENSLIKRPGA